MFFGAGNGNIVFSAEGKDIIPDNIILSVMLMKPSVRGLINKIFFGNYLRSAFIKIYPPAEVYARYIMKKYCAL